MRQESERGFRNQQKVHAGVNKSSEIPRVDLWISGQTSAFDKEQPMNANIDSPTAKKKKRARPSMQGSRFLKEFKEFTIFLRNLWGILAGISVFFPLSNILIQIVPLGTFEEGGVLVWLSGRVFTTFATVVSLFLILWTFGQRHRFQSARRRAGIQKQAWASFGIGLFALVVYLAAY